MYEYTIYAYSTTHPLRKNCESPSREVSETSSTFGTEPTE